MERIIGSDHRGGWIRDDVLRTERLLHRRAAADRCVRAGLLRLCTAVTPGAVRACCEAA